MKKSFFWAFLAIVFIGGGCVGGGEPQDIEEVASGIDRDSILFEAQKNGLIMTDEEISAMTSGSLVADESGETPEIIERYLETDVRGWASAALADVTGGESFGIAHTQFESGLFTLISNMGNLPDPAEGYFYEGWLVRRGESMSVISTGVAEKTAEGYVNVYTSKIDLSEYDFYVLTLEPNDEDPAPAEHILEGTLR